MAGRIVLGNHEMDNILETAIVWAIPLLFAITLHEASHAFVAKYLGDTTAFVQGRMTLNPIKHIDPLGTVIIPVALIMIGSPFIFGYAKPVPVNFGQLRHPRRDSALVALAGPASNLVMALLWAIFKIILIWTNVQSGLFLQMAEIGVLVNLVLFAFNLFPLPPLDGGRIMTSLLPANLAYKFAQVERYGFFIVLGLVYLGLTTYWMRPVMALGRWIVNLFLYPLIHLLS